MAYREDGIFKEAMINNLKGLGLSQAQAGQVYRAVAAGLDWDGAPVLLNGDAHDSACVMASIIRQKARRA